MSWRAVTSPEEVIRRIADYRATDKHDPVYYAGPHVERLRGIGSVQSRVAGGTISYGRSWTLAAKGKPRLGLADYADN
jgi:hypothetical protein